MATLATNRSAAEPYPDLATDQGRKAFAAHLIAQESRGRRLWLMKLGLVWVVLLAILTFGFSMLQVDIGYAATNASFVLEGLWTTVWVSLVAISIATALAMIGALGRLSPNVVFYGASSLYVSILRGTPLLVQIYIIYQGLPQIGQTLSQAGYPELGRLFILDAVQSGILALSLNYGAYMTEIFRAGIQSISGGQWQAAAALGLSRFMTLHKIILPQAIRTIIPAVGNQFIAMQKDSALVSVMGVWEITYRANKFARKDSMFMEMFLVAALAYWLLTIVSEFGQSRLENQMAKADRR